MKLWFIHHSYADYESGNDDVDMLVCALTNKPTKEYLCELLKLPEDSAEKLSSTRSCVAPNKNGILYMYEDDSDSLLIFPDGYLYEN